MPEYRRERFVDVSHVIETGMVTYPGLPAPSLCDFLSFDESRSHYSEGTEFSISMIEMVANTGTYVDSPRHRYRDGADLAALDLESLADLAGVVIRAESRHGRALGPEWFEGHDVTGKAVLIHTGWDRYWRTDRYFDGHPYLTEDAAKYLVERKPRLVGIDSLNIDDTGDGRRPVHTLLLGSGVPIAEHLCNLGLLPDSGFRFHAAPVKVRGMGSFPVRAYAVVA